MAAIRCSRDDEGTLIPFAVEFEPGDWIQVDPGDPASAIEVQTPFTLADLSIHLDQLMIRLSVARGFTIPNPDPKLPPPPPEQGGFITVIVGSKWEKTRS